MTEKEAFVPIIGYEHEYCVSNMGRIKSLPKKWTDTIGRKYSINEKMMKGSLDSHGYFQVNLKKDGIAKMHLVHRLVAIHFIPNPENKPEVNHKFGIKTDNRVSQLEWATDSENIKHAFAIGLNSSKGSRNARSKLTESEVTEIRKIHSKGGITQRKIAKLFNMSTTCICEIISKKIWPHI